MRILVGGLIAIALGVGAVAVTVAGATQLDRGGPYQVYIFDSHERHSIYAIAMGERAAAARVENCVGRLIEDPYATVSQLRARAREDHEDLNLVWVSGEGSNVNLGPCHEQDAEAEREDHSDSLVIVRDANARQVRSIIGEISLSADQRDEMIASLGLDRPRRGRR
jgi:hypothetical protein